MPNTDSFWLADTPMNDMEIFVGAMEFKDINNNGTFGTTGGAPTMSLASTLVGNFYVNVQAALKKTGFYPTPAQVQQQFGTAASLPGPTNVANTSDPEGIRGYPPFQAGAPATWPAQGYPAAQLPTLKGAAVGPVPKGLQVNSIDFIYQVNTVNLSAISTNLYAINYINNQAAVVTTLIPSGANGLPVAFRPNLYRFNIPVASPLFMTTQDSSLIIVFQPTAGSGGTLNFFGSVLKCSYNFS